MKMRGGKGNFLKPLQIALEMAGYEAVKSRRHTSHFVYKRHGSPSITVPAKIDDPKLFYRLRKLTEATNG